MGFALHFWWDEMKHVHLVFSSTLTNEFGHDLPKILESSTSRNAIHHVNAMFLFRHGKVIGLLQGGSRSVNAAFGRMTKDVRHFGFKRIYEVQNNAVELTGTSAGLRGSEFRYVVQHFPHLNVFSATADEIEQRVRPGTCRQLLLEFFEDRFPLASTRY
jgi:hypothetical protein